MPHVTGDRVKETTTTTGTGDITVLGAEPNFTSIASEATVNGDTFDYAIVHRTVNEWETGIGTRVSATVFSRSVLESSNADVLVSFSAGTKDVFIDRPARLAVQMKERAAPLPAAADWITTYAFDNGAEAQVRTKGEYGLVDILSQRDRQRSRKDFYQGLGSDVAVTASDLQTVGIFFGAIEGTVTNVAGTATEGQGKNFATVVTINSDAGPGFVGTQTTRDKNPDVTIKFRVNSTTLRRVWIGWMEADHMASDSTAITHKFALRLSTAPAVTGFTIVHSNGTTETVEAQIQASDALVHTIRLIADNANARFGYSFDGATVVWITANIPAAGAQLGLQVQIQNLEGVIKNMDYWFSDGSMEK